ncbi:Maf family protein [Planctomycetota bacterium]
MNIILASKSPRRTELLRKAGVSFAQVNPPEHAESEYTDNSDIRFLAVENAIRKAESVSPSYPDSIVIGADTIVISPDGRIFGKPDNEEEAFNILSALSGTTHSVVTGVAFIVEAQEIKETHMEETKVTMKNMSVEDIRCYIADDKPFDKAGAYAIQEGGDKFIDNVDGDFSNVVGLPVYRVVEMIGEIT